MSHHYSLGVNLLGLLFTFLFGFIFLFLYYGTLSFLELNSALFAFKPDEDASHVVGAAHFLVKNVSRECLTHKLLHSLPVVVVVLKFFLWTGCSSLFVATFL